jgi:hypothetical protein
VCFGFGLPAVSRIALQTSGKICSKIRGRSLPKEGKAAFVKLSITRAGAICEPTIGEHYFDLFAQKYLLSLLDFCPQFVRFKPIAIR